MRFSILTITFNAARYLEQTLASVKSQADSSFEHLIWDGGSTDETLDIVRMFPHAHLFEGKDRGISDAMNQIAKHAAGEFLLFLHSDDLLAHSQVLQMLDRALNLHPRAQWLYGRANMIDERGQHLRTTPIEPFSQKRLRKYNFITHPATIVSKSMFQRVGGFDPDLRYCMDYDLWLRLAEIAPPHVLTTPLACFREHSGSLSTNHPLHVAREAYQVRNRYIRSLFKKFFSYRTLKRRLKHCESAS